MKKIILPIVLSLLISPVMAKQAANDPMEPATTYHQNGGFNGPESPSPVLTDVISALNGNNEAKVVLTGNLISSLGDEDYVFQDKTGDITVEIDHDIWLGKVITPKMEIKIIGEVDRDWFKTTIDVDHIEIVEP